MLCSCIVTSPSLSVRPPDRSRSRRQWSLSLSWPAAVREASKRVFVGLRGRLYYAVQCHVVYDNDLTYGKRLSTECACNISRSTDAHRGDTHSLTIMRIVYDFFHLALFAALSLEVHLVHVAPAPVLARLERLDDRVTGRVEVFGGMPVLRVIAAADVAADQTFAQMDPAVAHLQALLAAVATRGHVANFVQVRAIRCHAILLAGTLLWRHATFGYNSPPGRVGSHPLRSHSSTRAQNAMSGSRASANEPSMTSRKQGRPASIIACQVLTACAWRNALV